MPCATGGANTRDTYYLLGSALGPHPLMVREFQSVIREEMRCQFIPCEKKLADVVIASIGGGSNAIGFVHRFVGDTKVRLTGVEPAKRKASRPARSAIHSRRRWKTWRAAWHVELRFAGRGWPNR